LKQDFSVHIKLVNLHLFQNLFSILKISLTQNIKNILPTYIFHKISLTLISTEISVDCHF
jgi:hypothetical protein